MLMLVAIFLVCGIASSTRAQRNETAARLARYNRPLAAVLAIIWFVLLYPWNS